MAAPINDADLFQQLSLRTASMVEHKLVKRFRELGDDESADELHRLLHVFNHAMGLAGETGEILDYLKKVLFHGTPLDKEKLTGEFGDGRWYGANLANDFGIKESEIQGNNVEKLKKRYPNGFTIEDAQARVDETWDRVDNKSYRPKPPRCQCSDWVGYRCAECLKAEELANQTEK